MKLGRGAEYPTPEPSRGVVPATNLAERRTASARRGQNAASESRGVPLTSKGGADAYVSHRTLPRIVPSIDANAARSDATACPLVIPG